MTETDYPDRLCAALMGLFEAGAQDLPEIVAGLNGAAFAPPEGDAWTEALLCAELHRLGRHPTSPTAPPSSKCIESRRPARPSRMADPTGPRTGVTTRWWIIYWHRVPAINGTSSPRRAR